MSRRSPWIVSGVVVGLALGTAASVLIASGHTVTSTAIEAVVIIPQTNYHANLTILRAEGLVDCAPLDMPCMARHPRTTVLIQFQLNGEIVFTVKPDGSVTRRAGALDHDSALFWAALAEAAKQARSDQVPSLHQGIDLARTAFVPAVDIDPAERP